MFEAVEVAANFLAGVLGREAADGQDLIFWNAGEAERVGAFVAPLEGINDVEALAGPVGRDPAVFVDLVQLQGIGHVGVQAKVGRAHQGEAINGLEGLAVAFKHGFEAEVIYEEMEAHAGFAADVAAVVG